MIDNTELISLLKDKADSYKLFGSTALEKQINLLKKINAKDSFIQKSKISYEKFKRKRRMKRNYNDLSHLLVFIFLYIIIMYIGKIILMKGLNILT